MPQSLYRHGVLTDAWPGWRSLATRAVPVEVVDTSGAGDSFVAGLSHALAAGQDLQLAVAVASRVAAWTVSASESVCRSLPSRVKADDWPGWSRLRQG